MIKAEDFFQQKISEHKLKLKHEFKDYTGEGKFWKVGLNDGGIIEFEWLSLSLDDPKYDELWIEYNKEKGGIIFDLKNGSNWDHVVIVPNDQIKFVE